MAEKAQQDPHYPWFSTGVTAPLAVQSTEAGKAPLGVKLTKLFSSTSYLATPLTNFSLYSSLVKAAKMFIPNLKDPVYSALNYCTKL